MPPPQDRGQLLRQRPVADLGQSNAWAIAGRTSSGSRIGARETKTTPSAKRSVNLGSNVQGEARLADAAGTGQRHQPDIVACSRSRTAATSPLAADQWRERNGERGELFAGLGGGHDEAPLGFAMLAPPL